MKRIVAPLCMLGLIFGAVSCGDEDLFGGADGGTLDSSVADGSAADSGAADQMVGDASTVTPYRFVRIEDNDTDPSGSEPGADIDAVGLIKGSAEEVYAGLVPACEDKDGNACTNPTEVTQAPDTFPNLPVLDECDVTGTPYVSLGGESGFLVVEMTADIESGDTLNVYEVGNCTVVGDGNTAKAEDISIYIGKSAAGPWEELTVTGNAPMYSIVVP